MDCIFYTFSKRPNSTALPGDGVKLDIQLKAPTDIIGPKISISMQNGTPIAYNYCNIPRFGRMYFIRNWTYNAGGVWVASLSEDVLASWREQIGETTQYVLRSSAQNDGSISDSRYPATSEVQTVQQSFQGMFSETIGGGFFVFGFISKNPNSIGAISYVIMSPNNAKALASKLLTNVSYLDIDNTEISDSLTKALFNPYQYVVSCNYFPFDSAEIVAHLPLVSSIDVGWWSIDVPCWIMGADNNNVSVTATVTLPKHPQAADRGAYCNTAPYSEYAVFYQPYGVIPIEGGKIWGASSISLTSTVDLFTGSAILRIKTDSGNMVTERSENLAVSIPLANISMQLPTNTGSLIQTGAAALFAGAQAIMSGQGISGAASGIMDAAQATNAEVASKGATGSTIAFDMPPYLVARFSIMVDDNNEDAGRPLCKRVLISSIPGFIMVYNPDVSLPATQAELDAIRGYMSGGFFYE